MQSIAVIYVRTVQGRVAAFNPASNMPEPLRLVLQAVDGKTPSSTHQSRFGSLGHVPDLLLELERHGLIEDRSTAVDPAISAPAYQPGASAAVPLRWVANKQNYLGSSLGSSNDLALLAQASATSASWLPTSTSELEPQTPSLETLLLRLTQQVADVMATFMLTHLPYAAFPVLAELESLRNPAQLKAMLPGYEALARSAGPAGHLHLYELHQLIAETFKAA